ncbi:MAG: hypothetical protein GY846_03320 [Deltaproteobacteria bacterium]|nr:hypothetical protein [Deltaproteobacteria bacterium]
MILRTTTALDIATTASLRPLAWDISTALFSTRAAASTQTLGLFRFSAFSESLPGLEALFLKTCSIFLRHTDHILSILLTAP